MLRVSTKVLVDQGRVTVRDMTATANAPYVAALESEGLDPTYREKLKTAVEAAALAEGEQERAKNAYDRRADEHGLIVDAGAAWFTQLAARVRHLMVKDKKRAPALKKQFRLSLGAPNARNVIYELTAVLPEVELEKAALAKVGVTDAFIDAGKKILSDLGVKLQDTAESKATREALTRRVREAEEALMDLFDELEAADAAAALSTPENMVRFPLDVLKAETARLDADAAARKASHVTPED